MESEKVKEIKKALECWQESVMLSTDENYIPHRVTNREILDYINELESENERLSAIVKAHKYCVTPKHCLEVKALKDQITELENENDEQYKRIMELEQDLVHADENVFYRECDVALQENKIKTEALKQFAERLKEKVKALDKWYSEEIIDEHYNGITASDIDETLKEFANDTTR